MPFILILLARNLICHGLYQAMLVRSQNTRIFLCLALYEISLQNLIDLYHVPFIPWPIVPPPTTSREYFKGPTCKLSNMYPCSIVFRGKQYSSSEQAYQHTRAFEIGETQIADELRVCQDHFRAKILSEVLDKTQRAMWESVQ